MTVGLTFCTVIFFLDSLLSRNDKIPILNSQVCTTFVVRTIKYDTFEVMSNLSISFDNANTEKLTHFELFRMFRDKILLNFPVAAAIKVQ